MGELWKVLEGLGLVFVTDGLGRDGPEFVN